MLFLIFQVLKIHILGIYSLDLILSFTLAISCLNVKQFAITFSAFAHSVNSHRTLSPYTYLLQLLGQDLVQVPFPIQSLPWIFYVNFITFFYKSYLYIVSHSNYCIHYTGLHLFCIFPPFRLWVSKCILYALCVLMLLASGTWILQILHWMNTWLNESVLSEKGSASSTEEIFRGREVKEKDTAVHTEVNFTYFTISFGTEPLCQSPPGLSSVYLQSGPLFVTWATICKTVRIFWLLESAKNLFWRAFLLVATTHYNLFFCGNFPEVFTKLFVQLILKEFLL